jgi:hypothetical protein
MVVDLHLLFDNTSPDNFCPIIKFSLTNTTQSEEDIEEAFYEFLTINTTHLRVSEFTPFLNIAIMAETANGKKGWKELNIALDQCGDQIVTAVA